MTYSETDSSYIKLSNGVMVEGKGGYRSAYLTDRILNADFNNDGHPETCYFSFAPSSIFKPAVNCPARSVLKEGKCTPVSDLCDKFDKTTGKC